MVTTTHGWIHKMKNLTTCGHRQAAKTAKALNNMPGRPVIKEIITSTMLRAKQTAEVIRQKFTDVPTLYDPDLDEGNPDNYRSGLRVYTRYFMTTQSCETRLLVSHTKLNRYLVCRYVSESLISIASLSSTHYCTHM